MKCAGLCLPTRGLPPAAKWSARTRSMNNPAGRSDHPCHCKRIGDGNRRSDAGIDLAIKGDCNLDSRVNSAGFSSLASTFGRTA